LSSSVLFPAIEKAEKAKEAEPMEPPITLAALINCNCSSAVDRAYAITKIIFIASQVIFIVRCSNSSYVLTKSLINEFFLSHTVTTNVVLYLTTFLESKKEFGIMALGNVNGTNDNSNSTPLINLDCTVTSEDYVDLFHSASRYLYPFLLEFTLTSSAILAELWMRAKGASSFSNTNEERIHTLARK
jgi:hypothetical protein